MQFDLSIFNDNLFEHNHLYNFFNYIFGQLNNMSMSLCVM